MATSAFNELSMHFQFASSVQGVITFVLGTETAIYIFTAIYRCSGQDLAHRCFPVNFRKFFSSFSKKHLWGECFCQWTKICLN